MPRRVTYSDTFCGKADVQLRLLLNECDDDTESSTRNLKKIMLNVIKNELTPRQKEFIMLYYFKDMDIVQLSRLAGVTPQAVSAAIKRARLKIYRFMQYCI